MSDIEQWKLRSENLVEGIRSIISELDDLSFDVLRQASREKTGRPTADKKLVQARRALEKAAHLLDQPGFEMREESELE
jgi:hypothetical protein